jgi:hypothetical protein
LTQNAHIVPNIAAIVIIMMVTMATVTAMMATATATIMKIAIMARCDGDAPSIEIVNAAASPLLWGSWRTAVKELNQSKVTPP